MALKWRHGTEDSDYKKEGIVKGGPVLPWEDGRRADLGPGFFEWWYFDTQFPDGSTVTFVFYTKELANVYEEPAPYVHVSVTLPNGKDYEGRCEVGDKGFNYPADKPYMVCGDSWFLSDLKTTMVHLDTGNIVCDLRMEGMTPSYRQHNGFWYLEEDDQWHLGWTNAHPKAKITGTLVVDGKKYSLKDGLGYRDHNWGNFSWKEWLDHWVWSKVYAGDYMFAPAGLVASEPYEFTMLPNFQCLKGNDVFPLDFVGHTEMEILGSSVHKKTQMKVPDKVRFTYKKGDDYVIITYTRKRDLKIHDNVEILPEEAKKMAKLMGMKSFYYRFETDTVVDFKLNGVKEHYDVPGIYEYQQVFKGVD